MSDDLVDFDEKFLKKVDELCDLDFTEDATTVAMKNLKLLSESRPPADEEVISDVVPTTFWGRFSHRAARVWDNETTRVFIKTGGAFAGVGVVAYSTIHKDHVMERQALAQANQIK